LTHFDFNSESITCTTGSSTPKTGNITVETRSAGKSLISLAQYQYNPSNILKKRKERKN